MVQKFRKMVTGFPEVVDFYRLSGDVRLSDPRRGIRHPRPRRSYQRLIAKIDLHDVSSMFAMEQIRWTAELPLTSLA
jgi:Lrp/AsnC family transcriptional regulator